MHIKWQMNKEWLTIQQKKNKLMIHATTRMNLKHIMLGLRSQTQKTKFYMI